MGFIFERNVRWVKFVMKIFGYVAVVNLFVLPILWISNLFSAVIFVYEGAFLVFVGGIQFLLSFIYYKKNNYSTIDQKYPYPGSGWLNHRIVFKRLTTEERKRYRQEGIIVVIIGSILWLTAAIAHFFIFVN
jgi:hypothetical protein